MARISVIIPTYNRAPLLKNAIESVLGQTYSVYEIIVVDDGSTDETGQVLGKYIETDAGRGQRICYVYQQRQGKSLALNNGLQHVQGEWVAFLDSDDVWLPDKLEWQVRAIQQFENHCGACFTDARFINNPYIKATAFQRARKYYKDLIGWVPDPVQFVASIPHGVMMQTLIVRTTVMRQIGEFDSKLFLHEDSDFLFRLALATKLCFVDLPLVNIDRTPNRAVGLVELLEKDLLRLPQRQYLYEKWLRLSEGQEKKVKNLIRERLRSIHSEWASFYLEKGEYERALEAVSTALQYRLTPQTILKWVFTRNSPELTRKIARRRTQYRWRKNDRVAW